MKLTNAIQNRSYSHTCKPPLRYMYTNFKTTTDTDSQNTHVHTNELFMIKTEND